MSETPDEAAIEVEFDKLLDDSSLNSPAAKFIRDIGHRQMEAWAKRQVILAAQQNIRSERGEM